MFNLPSLQILQIHLLPWPVTRACGRWERAAPSPAAAGGQLGRAAGYRNGRSSAELGPVLRLILKPG